MKNLWKIVIILVLAASVATVIAVKKTNKTMQPPEINQQPMETRTLPKMVDLGADKCIPCKMMAPILEEIKKDYAGTIDVEFIDVWKNPDKAKGYGISIIPTQIFYDASGKEVYRHEGFFAKEDIKKKLAEMGIK